MRFAININDFFSTNGPTRLVDRICAIFQITDQSRVKIVGIYNGSTVVNAQIATSTANNTDSQSFNSTTDIQAANNLNAQIQALNAQGLVSSQLTDFGLLSMDSQVIPVHPVDNSQADDTNKKIMIGVITSVVGLILITGGIVFYLKRTANNKVVDDIPEFSSGSEVSHEKGEKVEKKRDILEVQNITEENIS
jgi:hypothetical protein